MWSVYTTLGLSVPFAVSPCSTKVRLSPCSSLFGLFDLFIVCLVLRGCGVACVLGAAGSPRSCPFSWSSARRRRKKSRHQRVFFSALACVFFYCVRESRHQRVHFLRANVLSLTLSAVLVYCVSGSFWRFHLLIVVCILVVARAVESSCVLVRRLRYLASRRRRRREIADGRARRVGGGRSHIRSSYPSFRPRLCRDGPTKCPQK